MTTHPTTGPTGPATSAREEILTRIRHATRNTTNTTNTTTGTPEAQPAPEAQPEAGPAPAITRTYHHTHTTETTDLPALLAENLTDYRAHVHHAAHDNDVAAIAAELLGTDRHVIIPAGFPDPWIPTDTEILTDNPPLSLDQLDTPNLAVITTCALAIAETGTIILDTGPGQGRRALTLIPDHHICIVHCPDQLVASVPQALTRLDPTKPQTWIAGPSATSDIELDRVEGVHGPRRLDVILIEG